MVNVNKIKLMFNGKYSPANVYYPENKKEKNPAIVLCHGNYFKGKDEPIIVRLTKSLVDHGFIVINYDNLCYNEGWTPPDDVINSPEEIDFRWAVYACISYLEKDERVYKNNITVIGHSLGGTLSMAVGSLDDRVSNVVSISPTRVSRFIFEEEKLDEFCETNIKARIHTKMNKNIVRSLRAVTLEELYVDFLKTKPVLFVHGKEEEGYDEWILGLKNKIGNNAYVVKIENSYHYFGIEPDESNEDSYNNLVEAITVWIKRKREEKEKISEKGC